MFWYTNFIVHVWLGYLKSGFNARKVVTQNSFITWSYVIFAINLMFCSETSKIIFIVFGQLATKPVFLFLYMWSSTMAKNCITIDCLSAKLPGINQGDKRLSFYPLISIWYVHEELLRNLRCFCPSFWQYFKLYSTLCFFFWILSSLVSELK